MAFTESAFQGCLAGLALGDALGAPFEGLMPPLESGFDAFLKNPPPILRYTDDTEMAIGVAESLIARRGFDADHMARRFAENFDPSRGYGPGTTAVLDMIRRGVPWKDANRTVFPEGSFGNGAAMRAAPIGLFFGQRPDEIRKITFEASAVTHDHPLAKEGALLITLAISGILSGKSRGGILDELSEMVETPEYKEKLHTIREFVGHPVSMETVIEKLGHSVLAHESAPTALYSYLRAGHDYLKCIRFSVSVGGDTDTISAMAGALSGAKVGIEKIPEGLLERLEGRDKILSLASELFETCRD